MKELLRIMEKDYLKEGFSTSEMVTFGIIVPGIFVILLVMFSIVQSWIMR